MILSKEQILEELESGRLLIDPFDPSLVGAASVDLTVSRYFRRLSLHGGPIDVRQEADYRDYSELVEVAEDGCIEVNPRETILGITREPGRAIVAGVRQILADANVAPAVQNLADPLNPSFSSR